jgi:hypothetical protein
MMAGLDAAALARQDRVIVERRPQAWNSFDSKPMHMTALLQLTAFDG